MSYTFKLGDLVRFNQDGLEGIGYIKMDYEMGIPTYKIKVTTVLNYPNIKTVCWIDDDGSGDYCWPVSTKNMQILSNKGNTL